MNGTILFFDQIENIKTQLIEQYCKDDVLVILVGNKTDLEDGREVTTVMHKIIAQRCMFAFETSALTGSNIDRLFTTLFDAVPDTAQPMHTGTLDIFFPPPGLNTTKYCC